MKKSKIIYEDKEIIVVDKEPNYLTIATEKNNKSLYQEVSKYVKKQYPKNKIFIVHRLDKETSGLIIFAKNQEKKRQLQEIWPDVTRKYYAIVEGIMPKKEDTLINYLQEDQTHKVYVTNNPKASKAITSYKVIKENKNYSLLEIEIKTGKKNQIRVQLAHIKHPIIGDKKYNSTKNPIKRLALHAYLIEYQDNTKQQLFTSPLPETFKYIFK